jgi:hypothetical protein
MVWESFWQTPSGLSCVFYLGVVSVWPLYHKGLIGGVLQRLLSFWKVLPSPRRNSGALSEWPLGYWSPPWPRPVSIARLLSLAGRPAPERVLVVLISGGHCILGDLQCCRNVLIPFPRSVPRHNPVSEFYGQFLLTSWLGFLLWHSLSTVGPYIDRCVPFQIMSNQLNFPQVDSTRVVETSQGWSMETGCTWAQFRVS